MDKLDNQEIQRDQCINCCAKDVSMTSFEHLRLMSGMTKIFNRELDRRLPPTGNSVYIAMCHLCNSELSSLSNSYEDFRSRTHSNSLISCLGKSNLKDRNDFNNKTSNLTSHYESEAEGDSILPMDCLENQSDGNTVQNVKQENKSIVEEYHEKFVQIKIPQLVLTTMYLRPTPAMYNCKFSCDECSRKFFWSGFLENHRKTVHRKQETISCTLCDKLFVNKWFFENHLKSSHGGITLNFVCKLCGDNFRSQNELNTHNLSTHTITTQAFNCNHCETAYGKEDDIKLLREHLIKFHPNTSEAKVAQYNTRLERYLRRPIHSRGMKIPCPSCEVEFLDRRILFSHIAFVHFDHNICDQCNKSFTSDVEFRKHRSKTFHSLSMCRKCPKDLLESRALIKHLRWFHNPDRGNAFTCEICAVSYKTYRRLKMHYKWHVRNAGTGQYKCAECEMKFIDHNAFKLHMKNSHVVKEVPTKPQRTDKRKRRKRKAKNSDSDPETSPNLKVARKTDVSKCTLCNSDISGVLKMWNHFVECHPKTSEAEVSEANLKRYQQNGKLKGQSCEANRCSICKTFFTSVPEKDKHDEIIHKKVFCQICKNNFPTESQLRKHEADVHNEFPCNYCQYVGTHSEDFHTHLLKEHLFQPYICEFCGKYFKPNLVSLSVHYQKHLADVKVNPVQNYVCAQCNSKFVSESTLKRHQKKTCKSRPMLRSIHRVRHTCKQCGQTFSKTFSYENHMMQLHKVYAGYECDDCGLLYYDLKGLNWHIRRVHNGIIKVVYFNELPPPKHFSAPDKKYKCPRLDCGKLCQTVGQFNTHITRDHLGVNILNGKSKSANKNVNNQVSKFKTESLLS